MDVSTPSHLATEGTVRIATVSALPSILTKLGFNSGEILGEFGLDETLFDNPDTVISYSMRSKLIQHCANRTECPHLGLLIGQHGGPSAFGLVGFLMQQSANLKAALLSLVRFAHLHVRGALIYLEEEGDSAFLGYTIYLPGTVASDQIEDGAVAIAFNILRRICGPKWEPLSVHIAHRKPADIKPFKQFFQAPLNFDSDRNGISFSSRWLQQPLQGADPELNSLLQKQVDHLAASYGDDFVAQVTRALHSALITHRATAEQLAALFSIHPRTLSRRLKACGTSFQALLGQGRFDLAKQYLENSTMGISQIAAALDYADASAFTRAFRGWSGVTPAVWREQSRHRQSGAQ